ncbi:MAG: histidinol phosphatase, partial [Muriicola sp.]|nr:histidinol phosphatase [Muriicola sp.]
HMIDSHFETLFGNNSIMPLRSRHLLIEMSYLQASLNFEVVIEMITSAGFFPILAHPERYRYLHEKKGTLEMYKEKSVLFQLNLLSLGEFYGKDIQRVAIRLINENMIDYVGSDVHSLKQLNVLKEITVSSSIYDKVIPLVQNTIRDFY